MNSIGESSISSSSISAQLRAVVDGRTKRYTHLLDPDGFEIGFGPRGQYPGHAHLHFCDLLYAPGGLACRLLSGTSIEGQLMIVPPRTYFGPVDTNEFFFMKFVPDARQVQVPDKVDDRLTEGVPIAYQPPCTIEMPWYHPIADVVGRVAFVLNNHSLLVSIEGKPFLEVVA